MIGAAVARRAKGFDMKLIYYDTVRNREMEQNLGIEFVPKEKMLKECNFFSIHVPLLPETEKSISRKELMMMKKTASLINTSKGEVVDEAALIDALKEKRIAGAALDVFEREPVEPSNPLLRMDNVIIVPHIASASLETRVSMGVIAANNIVAALRDEVPQNLLNTEPLQKRASSETSAE